MADSSNLTTEAVDTFTEYLKDISLSPLNQPGTNTWHQKTQTVLARFADTVIKIAASSLLSKDVDIKTMTNEELANAMQRHVTFRGGARLPNSAWSMMLEASSRLRNCK